MNETKLNYTIVSNTILSYIKEAEKLPLLSLTTKNDGYKKKEFVLKMIQENMPDIYENHGLLIDVIIDSIILVSNNPSIIKIEEKIIKGFFMCCGC